jgi:hypothetical protein
MQHNNLNNFAEILLNGEAEIEQYLGELNTLIERKAKHVIETKQAGKPVAFQEKELNLLFNMKNKVQELPVEYRLTIRKIAKVYLIEIDKLESKWREIHELYRLLDATFVCQYENFRLIYDMYLHLLAKYEPENYRAVIEATETLFSNQKNG